MYNELLEVDNEVYDKQLWFIWSEKNYKLSRTADIEKNRFNKINEEEKMNNTFKTLNKLNIDVHSLLELKRKGDLDKDLCKELLEAYKNIAITWQEKGNHSESGQALDISNAVFQIKE